MPEDSGDWDEAGLRTKAAEETERLTEEAQPGKVEEIEGASTLVSDGVTGIFPVPPGADAQPSVDRRRAGRPRPAGRGRCLSLHQKLRLTRLQFLPLYPVAPLRLDARSLRQLLSATQLR